MRDPARITLGSGVVARYAIGSIGTGGFSTLPGLVLVYYLTDSLGVTALAAGFIVTLAKVWDVAIDPVIGSWSDRALARTGSRRGPMLLGAIGLPFAFVATFSVPPSVGPVVAGCWVGITFVAAATFFSLFQVPYIALPAELTADPSERTRLLTWRVMVLTLAILLFGAGGPEIRGLFPENPTLGYLVMAAGAACVIGLGLVISAGVARPRYGVSLANGNQPRSETTAPHDAAESPKSSLRLAPIAQAYRDGLRLFLSHRSFRQLLIVFMLQGLATGLMLAGAQYVATWILHDESAVTILFVSLIAPAILVTPFWKLVADRRQKLFAFRLASVLFFIATAALTAMIWLPGWWILAPLALAGTAYAGMQSLPLAMLPDLMAEDAQSRAQTAATSSRSGQFGGVWTAGETMGMALGATTLSIALALTGYVSTTAGEVAVQPAPAMIGIAVAFSALPALLLALSLLVLRSYVHPSEVSQ